ncbi:MAG TPA: radical SAM protein [Patescibacteria group bacterium]|nr:radical SAM protein [Patescibacteria group bacterium]
MDERVFPSLGLLRVAASLEQQGHAVQVLDLTGIENFLKVLEQFLAGSSVTMFGLSATTPQLPAVARIAEVIRAQRPLARLILGGPHVTLLYSAQDWEQRHHINDGRGQRALTALAKRFDVLVAGDGELAVHAAIATDAPWLVNGDDRHGPYFMTDAIYEATPLPARHLIDLGSYHYSIEGRPATSLIAQLGCPFSCGFCGGRNSKSLRVPRHRSAGSLTGELEMLHRRYGYTGFMLYDDELNVNRKRFLTLLAEIRRLQDRLGVEFSLRGFIKAELFDAEQAQAMYAAGFRWLLCGFEACTPRILTNINKRATLDDNDRAVAIAKDAGLKIKALMSCGHPGDSENSILAIRDWLISRCVDDFDCSIITPYPGTPYYDEAKPHPDQPGVWTYTTRATGDRLHSQDVDYFADAQYYKGDPDGGYKSFVFTDHLRAEDIARLRDQVEREVRAALGIPFNASRAAQRFEHSMGQGLPEFILRRRFAEAGETVGR